MIPLHAYLVAGLIAHKAVWEALRLRGERTAEPFRPIKLVKMALLAGFLLQPFLPALLPIGAADGFHIVIGTLAYTAGLAIAIAARVTLGRNWSNVESAALVPGQQLVSSGIYGHMRHPIYAGDVLLVAGYEMALNSWLALIAVPLAVYVWRKAGQEERVLAAKLAGYAEYVRRSGRFVPRCAAIGIAAAGICLVTQFTLVELHYGGNWTAFYLTGEMKVPAELAGENLYVHPGSAGYDGQYYHLIGHDPLLRRGFARYIDVPRMRYPRILAPAMAHALALGRDQWIDPAFSTLLILSYGFGAWCLASFAELHGRTRFWGLAYFLAPAALIGIDRITVDPLLLALCCGFVYYASRRDHAKVFAILTLAALCRDTGLLLWGAYGLHLLFRGEWSRAVVFGFAALPAAAWTAYVYGHASSAGQPDVHWMANRYDAQFAYSAFLHRFFEPVTYAGLPRAAALAAAVLDYVSLIGVLAAVVLAILWLRGEPKAPLRIAAAVFAALPFLAGGVVGWYEPFSYPRTLTPLLALLIAAAIESGRRVYFLPLVLILPRIAMQLAPKIPGMRALMG